MKSLDLTTVMDRTVFHPDRPRIREILSWPSFSVVIDGRRHCEQHIWNLGPERIRTRSCSDDHVVGKLVGRLRSYILKGRVYETAGQSEALRKKQIAFYIQHLNITLFLYQFNVLVIFFVSCNVYIVNLLSKSIPFVLGNKTCLDQKARLSNN